MRYGGIEESAQLVLVSNGGLAIVRIMGLQDKKPERLRRLPAEWYRDGAWVHWSMAIKGRQRGWLDEEVHSQVRELLLHTLARYQLMCPAYCLMPDHAHFLLMGLAEGADQKVAVKFFRRYWNAALKSRGVDLQKQPYDHVLDESERNPDAFEETCAYIFNNPKRGKLVADWKDWQWLGSLAVGYPDLDPRGEKWRERFWLVHNKEKAS